MLSKDQVYDKNGFVGAGKVVSTICGWANSKRSKILGTSLPGVFDVLMETRGQSDRILKLCLKNWTFQNLRSSGFVVSVGPSDR